MRRTTLDNVSRAHELIQRTNQLNFSGNHYRREAVEELVRRADILPVSISCCDRFGEYGLVGFCLFHPSSGTVTDLMFSCRVQAKHVEHAFPTALMRWSRQGGSDELRALYKKTAKNSQAAKVFEDLGFSLAALDEERMLHTFVSICEVSCPSRTSSPWTGEWRRELGAGGVARGEDPLAVRVAPAASARKVGPTDRVDCLRRCADLDLSQRPRATRA